MWILPTLDRPESLARVIEACRATGMSTPVLVVVNHGQRAFGYAEIEFPVNWTVEFRDDNIGMNGALNGALASHPNELWYGILGDDNLPKTPGWDVKLIAAAGKDRIASCADGFIAPPRMGGATVLGGDLVRAMGHIVLPGLWHAYADDYLETIGRSLKCWTILKDVVVTTVNGPRRDADGDATQKLAYSRYADDERRFNKWDADEKIGDLKSISAKLGRKLLARDLRGVKLMLATPLLKYEQAYLHSMMGTAIVATRSGVEIDFKTVRGGICEGRNLLAAQFLASKSEYLLFADSDMGWQPDAVARLLMMDKPLVGAIGRQKREELRFCVNPLPGPAVTDPETGLWSVAELGAGFLMIRRDCMQKMFDAYRDRHAYTDRDTGTKCVGVFNNEIHSERFWTEDNVFCQRWRTIGGTVWADPTIHLDHVGEKVYGARPADHWPQLYPQPATAAD